ncbi:transporter substrate-binding domain-containing protein [Aestuariibacter sp. A3R04]|uniref:transporter substrate-binding domain-containing protein n=1 Tax=Aestuariibacter sp. A3R04 TaxID=2841571 RepID=UPI001C0910D8|nr:transporter substrate-binding domain-containing protein [Aestuariibacter sp. A3R04]
MSALIALSNILLSAPANATKMQVTYCIDPDWMPYEALRNGKHIGVSADYLDVIAELTGIEFVLVPTENWQDSLTAVESGKCMITPMINKTPSRETFLAFSHSYIDAPSVLIGQRALPIVQGFGGVGNRRVGIVAGFRHAEYLARYYPNVSTQYVGSELEGLKKVSSGEIDLMVSSLLSVYTLINSHNLDNLSIVGFAEPFNSLSIGVNTQYTYLLPVLNQAINQIPESREVQIYKRWTSVKQVQNPRYWPMVFIVFGAIGFVALVSWRNRVVREFRRQITNKNNEIEVLQNSLLEKTRILEFLSIRDDISGLYNRNYFVKKVEEEISRYQRFQHPCTLIGVELPEFSEKMMTKDCRDNCSRKLATICLSTVRDVDVTARTEANRFVILCPQTRAEEAGYVANRLLEQFLATLPNCKYIHVGVAELQSAQDYVEWNNDLTKAIISSKHQGGNVVAFSD